MHKERRFLSGRIDPVKAAIEAGVGAAAAHSLVTILTGDLISILSLVAMTGSIAVVFIGFNRQRLASFAARTFGVFRQPGTPVLKMNDKMRLLAPKPTSQGRESSPNLARSENSAHSGHSIG